ncbi:MAG: SAM-dependent methyltransferase, partial [Bacteroidota bacterium]|nr:SAM-dependent methyltransferase [Bacteroidota bacterium]MDX5430187.1 SAM-dependent methyltransferase [Bacteroidota bacterium]MDX5468950.1 SAM-dependent methyltransferase [Bacteroidota bacterium]
AAKKAKADVGLFSDAGVPCVADPGSQVVAFAHELGMVVKPHVGPSSVLLALMASGFNGQQFAFHGYLPIQEAELKNFLQQLELESARKNQTQIFIETPYRNNKLLENLIKYLKPSTSVCIAADLQSEKEEIRRLTLAEWNKTKLDFHKRPAVFLLMAR